ncbi:hypothetical protein C8R42DRAFT_642251 [Lentinula raphanica]|nr:hypothetical protein C8R42DRAFT_642251 [Lentinula raphanica]
MEGPTPREAFYAREHDELMYERALREWEADPANAEKAFEVIMTYGKVESLPTPAGGTAIPSFPIEVYDTLVDVDPEAISVLPRRTVAMAIGWNPAILKHLACGRPEGAVVIFNEADASDSPRFVIFYGGERQVTVYHVRRDHRFYTTGSLDEMIRMLYEHWEADPPVEECDRSVYGASHGVRIIRRNVTRVYMEGNQGGPPRFDISAAMERVWNWMGNDFD